MVDGMIFDRVSCMYLDAATHAAVTARREEMAFQRELRQGELAAPNVIRDGIGGIHGLQSQQDGKFYDSKRALRRHYRESGVLEVGNDVPEERGKPPVDPKRREKIKDSVGRAFQRVGLPTT